MNNPLLDIPEDLVPSRGDDEKPHARITLDFDGLLLDPPLALRQDLKNGCGGQTWPAGMVLAEYLLRCELGHLAGQTMFVML